MKAIYSHGRLFELALVHNFSCNRTIVELINRLTFTALSGFPTVVSSCNTNRIFSKWKM